MPAQITILSKAINCDCLVEEGEKEEEGREGGGKREEEERGEEEGTFYNVKPKPRNFLPIQLCTSSADGTRRKTST